MCLVVRIVKRFEVLSMLRNDFQNSNYFFKNEIARLQFHKSVKLHCMTKNISSVIENISTR